MGQVEAPERKYFRALFERLRGRYPTLHEPCCGSFAISLIGREVGYPVELISASDICLYSSVLGALATDTPLASLGVTYGGAIVEGPADLPYDHAAIILWTQLLARLRAKPDVEYWHELIADLYDRRMAHIGSIKTMLQGIVPQIRGINYQARDLVSHVLESSQDEGAITVVMAPTYKGGFERFFNTGGLLDWNEPEYDTFDPDAGPGLLLGVTENRPGLVIVCQRAGSGEAAHDQPIYARALGQGMSFYLMANRPEEVMDLMGGPMIMPRGSTGDYEPMDYEMLGFEEELPENAEISVVRIGKNHASYYRQLWMHRIVTGETALSFAAIVNGRIVGVGGISFDTMQMPLKGAVYADAPMIRYAVGAPHKTYRFGRLMTMLCLSRSVLRKIATPGVSLHAEAAERLVTTCYTNYPEAKYLRGIMKLVERAPGTMEQYRLIYAAEPKDETPQQTYERWLMKEIAYASR